MSFIHDVERYPIEIIIKTNKSLIKLLIFPLCKDKNNFLKHIIFTSHSYISRRQPTLIGIIANVTFICLNSNHLSTDMTSHTRL